MKLLLAVTFLGCFLLFASEKMSKKDLSVLGNVDKESLDKVENSKHQIEKSPSGPKVFVTCKDIKGQEYKKGDAGFDTCMHDTKNQAEIDLKSKANPLKNKNSPGISIKIGE
jgi:hypothetical protein